MTWFLYSNELLGKFMPSRPVDRKALTFPFWFKMPGLPPFFDCKPHPFLVENAGAPSWLFLSFLFKGNDQTLTFAVCEAVAVGVFPKMGTLKKRGLPFGFHLQAIQEAGSIFLDTLICWPRWKSAETAPPRNANVFLIQRRVTATGRVAGAWREPLRSWFLSQPRTPDDGHNMPPIRWQTD